MNYPITIFTANTIRIVPSMSVRLQNKGLTHSQTQVPCVARTKKADVVEHPKAFDHVGLLFNKPLGTAELFFI